MFTKNNTKRALVSSALALVLCVAMLVGTTFAWFTDSATAGVNTIQSGTLDLALVDANGDSLEGTTLDFVAFDGRSDILWEPGCTYNTEEFYIKNNGNLKLKFKMDVTGAKGDTQLLDVIDFTAKADASWFKFNTGAVSIGTSGEFDMLEGYEVDTYFYGTKLFTEYVLEPGATVGPIAVTGHMDETAGNIYQGLALEGLAITLTATQATGEEDSFNGNYDENAQYAGTGVGSLATGETAVEIEVIDNDVKLGTAVVPAAAIAANNSIKIDIDDTVYEGNIQITAGLEKKSYEVTVEGLVDNNTEELTLKLFLGEDYDPATVKLYHYDEEIPCSYNPLTGWVTFKSATFSPFTIVYDAGSEYVPPVADESKFPTATVVNSPEYENTDLAWGSYGSWSPTKGLEANLEKAYTFSCNETLAEASLNPYANWECDFFVKLNRDLAPDQIFLGGNYGSFGWVGFHNGSLEIPANTEVALLGSVTNNPWTYLDVVQNVGTFICGVGDVDDALSGATFTVTLRLTNPENENDFVDAAVINYTFN